MASIYLRVLSLINEERNSYGLRLNEYERYREHCSRKISTLRQKLKLTHGRGREYKKTAPVPAANISDGHLQLILYEAERSWTYSQQLSSQRDADQTSRRRATGRFRRAVHSAAALKDYALTLYRTRRIKTVSVLEIIVYFFILEGRFHIRKDSFQQGIEFLSLARFILDQLIASSTTSHDQALYTLFSDEIAPQIRFAAHSLGRSKAHEIDFIIKEVAPRAKGQLLPQLDETLAQLSREKTGSGEGSADSVLQEVRWEGTPISVRNPELVDAFLKVQRVEDILRESQKSVPGETLTEVSAGENRVTTKKPSPKSSKNRITAYDDLLLALSDAEAVARRLLEAQELSGARPTSGESGSRDINFIHSFISFRLLSRRIERDLLLVDSLTSHQTPRSNDIKGKQKQSPAVSEDPRLNAGLVKLYDTILQSLEQMRTLSVVDESVDLVPAIEAKLTYSKARRALYLSRSYAIVNKFAETLALTAKAQIYLREARSNLDSASESPEDNFYSVTLDDITSLESILIDDELHTKKEWFAHNGGRISSLETENVPHRKPLFFDVAFNYVELPMNRLQERAQKTSRKGTAAPVSAPDAKGQPALSPGEAKEGGKEKRLATKVEEEVPAVKIVDSTASYGISGILGGWWGRK